MVATASGPSKPHDIKACLTVWLLIHNTPHFRKPPNPKNDACRANDMCTHQIPSVRSVLSGPGGEHRGVRHPHLVGAQGSPASRQNPQNSRRRDSLARSSGLATGHWAHPSGLSKRRSKTKQDGSNRWMDPTGVLTLAAVLRMILTGQLFTGLLCSCPLKKSNRAACAVRGQRRVGHVLNA